MNNYDTIVVERIARPPSLSTSDIKLLMKNDFGVEVSNITTLESYDDLNFLVKSEETEKQTVIKKNILKIHNSHESKNVDLFLAQNKMMLYLSDLGLNVPKPVENLVGSTIMLHSFCDHESKSDDSPQYLTRLLDYVEGKLLDSIPFTSQLMHQYGHYIAKFGLLLKDFVSETIRQRNRFRWMMESLPDLNANIITDPKQKDVIDRVVAAWVSDVVPSLNMLEKGFLHGDLNTGNVLVVQDEHDSSKFNISGLIDFGDVCYGAYITELAIAVCYIMLETTVISPLDIPGYVIAGYEQARTIPDMEWEVLMECICARLAQSLIMGAHGCIQEPENKIKSAFNLKTWSLLKLLCETPKQELLRRWKERGMGDSST